MFSPDVLMLAEFDLLESMKGFAGAAFVAVLALLGMGLFAAQRYKRCPSNRVLVIYGKVGGGQSARCIHGGASLVWPVIQNYGFLSLEPIQIEVPLKDALSIENIRVNVPSVFTVALGTEPEIMQNAAIRLLGLNTAQIKKQAEDIIFGQLRQVIASMQIEDINRDREMFLRSIQSSLEPELRKIGLVLINVNITDITDESGYIIAIGRKAASEAVQKARGDVAEQEKLGEVRVAEAERDKRVQVAEANKVQEIGIRSANREQAIRIAELDKEQQVGEQKSALLRELEVADAERAKRVSVAKALADALTGEANADQERRIAVASANATAVAGESESQALIADAEAQLQVKRADAFQIGETRKREAEAAVVEAQNLAMAKAALAEAAKVEAEFRAQLEAPAKAAKAKAIVDAEAEAEKRKLEAQGEAAAIFAKLEAEANGQYEILAKKGDGLKRIVEACGGADKAFQLMMLEHLDNLADASAKAISNIKFDKIIVWDNGGQNGKSATSGFLQNMSRTLPPMMQVMKDIGGVELPEYLAKFTTAEESNGAEPANGEEPATAEQPTAEIATNRITPAKKSDDRKSSKPHDRKS